MKILLAVKDKDTGLALVDFAERLFSAKSRSYVVMHVIPAISSYVSFAPLPELIDDCVRRDRAEGDEVVQAVAAQLRENGESVVLEKLVVEGNPAEEILTVSQKLGCDLILLNFSGANAIDKWLWGNVSAAVTARARCATLLVHSVTNDRSHPVVEGRKVTAV